MAVFGFGPNPRSWLVGLILLGQAGCVGTPPEPAPEVAGPDAAVAVVEWRDPVRILAIDSSEAADSRGFGGHVMRVEPGRRALRYEAVYGGSVIYCGAFHATAGVLTADLEAGHRYLVDSDKITSTCTIYVWLEDRAEGRLVAGRVAPARAAELQALAVQKGETGELGELRAAADAGDADSAYELAMHYLLGDPPLVRPDEASAITWLKRAAALGHGPATSLLQRLSSQ